MDLMITCPLVLPDVALDLAQLEAAVHAWGLRIQREALGRAWTAQAALRPPAACPTCQSTDLRPAGSKARQIETSFGPVRLERRRMRCRGCGRHAQPDDAVLGPALGRGRCTPALRELAASYGASWPYRPAARLLGRLRGAPISPETVRAIVRLGLQHTKGSYRLCAELFNLPPEDYKRFLSFLQKHDCQMPFQRFRMASAQPYRDASAGPGDVRAS